MRSEPIDNCFRHGLEDTDRSHGSRGSEPDISPIAASGVEGNRSQSPEPMIVDSVIRALFGGEPRTELGNAAVTCLTLIILLP